MKTTLIAIFVLLALSMAALSAPNDVEKKKIDFLISAVEEVEGASFVRNGSAYGGKKAASHLRMKLKYAGDRVQTADDFIAICASKSYFSGKPYLIRLPAGNTVKSDEFLRRKLVEYNSTH